MSSSNPNNNNNNNDGGSIAFGRKQDSQRSMNSTNSTPTTPFVNFEKTSSCHAFRNLVVEMHPHMDHFDHERPPWPILEEVENQRRSILQRVELPFWRILSFWTGTCLRSLALDWMIWIPLVIFGLIRYQARTATNQDEAIPAIIERLGDTDIDILGGFLSFLLVLFVNQTNGRFFTMYGLAKKCAGEVQNVAGLVVTMLPAENPQEGASAAAHRLVRYMNAAHMAGYVGLGGPYSRRHFFDHFNQNYTVLTKQEMARIEHLQMDEGSAVFKELITWCQRDVGRAVKAGQLDSYQSLRLHQHILGLRGSMDGIYDHCDQPTHFFYVHFLCLLSVLYLPLFALDNAYSSGWGDESNWSLELLNGTIVLVQAIFVVGLRLLGQKMTDPFGLDWEDLSVITYVSTTLDNCRIILSTPPGDEVDPQLEKQISTTAAISIEQQQASF